MKVADQFYVYLWNDPRENNCNTIFIDGKVPVLIDPGIKSRLQDLFSRMRADGVDPGKIRLIISTTRTQTISRPPSVSIIQQ